MPASHNSIVKLFELSLPSLPPSCSWRHTFLALVCNPLHSLCTHLSLCFLHRSLNSNRLGRFTRDESDFSSSVQMVSKLDSSLHKNMDHFCCSPAVGHTREPLATQCRSDPEIDPQIKSKNSLLFMGSQRSSSRSFDSSLSFQSQGSLSSMASYTDLFKTSPQSQVSNSSRCSSPSEGKLKFQDNLMHRCLTTLTGHVGLVSSIAVAGDLLYTASQGNDIRIWRQPDLVECGRFGCGEGAVKAILVAGDQVFSAHQDHKIRVWRRSRSQQQAGHKLLATLPTVKDYLLNCVSQKNYVQIRRHHKRLWIQHVDTISVLAVGNNNLLYSGSWDKTVKVWRLSDLKCLESIQAHDDAVNALVVGADGFVYTASADGKVKVWTKKPKDKKHSLVTTLEGHKSAVNALALSREGAYLYSGGSDGGILVWGREEAGHMSLSGILKGHRLPILCLCTEGNLLFSGSADKSVRVWKRGVESTLSCVAVLGGHKGPVKSISVSAEKVAGCLVYSGSLDKSIKVWWVSDGKEGSRGSSSDSVALDW